MHSGRPSAHDCRARRASCSVVATATSGTSPLHAAGLASLKDGGGTALDVLLRGDAHHERGDVDRLLADSDVLLEDEHTGVVDGLSEVALLNKGLEATLKELRGGQTEHVIELALVVLQQTKSNHAADQGLAY